MTADLPRWAMGDPARIVERLEEAEQRRQAKSHAGKAERARIGIEQLFAGDSMGRRLEIPGYVEAAMYQWGAWAARPQFWTNLSVTPFCKLVGIGNGRSQPDVALDPKSMAIHKAVMRTDDKTKAVLYAYYVAGATWSSYQLLFTRHGVSESTFHRLLKTGSVSVVNSAKIS